jgi:hypothetical protein
MEGHYITQFNCLFHLDTRLRMTYKLNLPHTSTPHAPATTRKQQQTDIDTDI